MPDNRRGGWLSEYGTRSLGGLSSLSICNSKPLLTSAAGLAYRVVRVLRMTTARPPGKKARPGRGLDEMDGRTDGLVSISTGEGGRGKTREMPQGR